MLELVVALVVLGILAALAIPTYTSVITSARNGVASSTALSVADDAIAIAAHTSSYPSQADFITAAGETTGVSVVSGSYSDVSGVTTIHLSVVTSGTTEDVCVSLPDQVNAAATLCGTTTPTTLAASAPVGYVFDNTASKVEVINPASLTVTTSIPVTGGALTGVLSPSKTTLYVANPAVNSISVIDTSSNSVTGTYTAGVASPSALAVSADGSTLYVANAATDTIAALSLPSGSLSFSAPVTGSPKSLALADAGARLFIGLQGGQVDYLDLGNHTEVSSVNTIATTPIVRSNPSGTQVWVGDQDGIIYVINAATNSNTTIAPGLNGVTDTAFNQTGSIAYETNNQTSSVSLFNTSSLASAGSDISLPAAPWFIAADSTGTYALISTSASETLVLNISTNSYSGLISTGVGNNQVLMN